MKTLYMIRHAKSSWEIAGLRDFDRPLNDRGLRDAPVMAQVLRSRIEQPVLLVASPANRALSTARFFAAAFAIPDESIVRDINIYDAMDHDLKRVISHLPDAADTVLLFGHNPGFTNLANHFTDDFISNIPTCGMVQIVSTAENWADFTDNNSILVWKQFPKDWED
jgi:phosphohistidine phosphatase